MVSAANLALVVVTLGGIYILMGLGLTIVYGITKVFNFAQGSFFLWGGYIAWTLLDATNLSYGAVFVITAGIMFLFGMGYEKAFIRPLRRFEEWGWTAIIVTLGSALLLDNLTLLIWGPRGKTLDVLVDGVLRYGSISFAIHDALIVILSMSIAMFLIFFFQKTKIGKAMRAVAQDATGGNIVGIPSDRMYSYAFGITAMLGGIAGMLLAPRTQIYYYVGWPVLVKALVVVVFGGLGSIKGTLVAAFILAAIEVSVTNQLEAIWALPIFMVVLLIVLAIRPKGLFGEW